MKKNTSLPSGTWSHQSPLDYIFPLSSVLVKLPTTNQTAVGSCFKQLLTEKEEEKKSVHLSS